MISINPKQEWREGGWEEDIKAKRKKNERDKFTNESEFVRKYIPSSND